MGASVVERFTALIACMQTTPTVNMCMIVRQVAAAAFCVMRLHVSASDLLSSRVPRPLMRPESLALVASDGGGYQALRSPGALITASRLDSTINVTACLPQNRDPSHKRKSYCTL